MAFPLPHTAARPIQDLAGPGLRAFFRLADLWRLSGEEQRNLLGEVSRATFTRWKKDAPKELSKDTLERLSYLLGIWKSLQILIPDQAQALGWIRTPNLDPFFAGRPPLERLLQGRMLDLADVRRFLDARRGIW